MSDLLSVLNIVLGTAAAGVCAGMLLRLVPLDTGLVLLAGANIGLGTANLSAGSLATGLSCVVVATSCAVLALIGATTGWGARRPTRTPTGRGPARAPSKGSGR